MNLTIEKSIQEHCGIVGVFTPRYSNTLPTALTAASALQHRGQQGAGIALKTKNGLLRYIGNGLLSNVFTQKVIALYNQPNRWVMVHSRYGTQGDYNKDNLQPCLAFLPKNDFVSVIHNGQFVAVDKIRKAAGLQFTKKGGESDTFLFTHLLASAKQSTWDEKILATLAVVDGSYSLLIGVDDCLYAARDPYGLRPLVLGRVKNGWIFASETCALDKIGVKVVREVKQGEVLRIDGSGLKVLKKGLPGPGHFCDFEWAYFSRPNSLQPTDKGANDSNFLKRWFSFTSFRERCGQILAKESHIPHASFVVGIPDSGMIVAMGYSNKAGLPYRQVIIRDHFDPDGLQRLFMRDDQLTTISKRVIGKLSLIPEREIWRNAVVVVGDDSIVRGNVSSTITKAIFSFGAKEVHWIVGFPPVTHPCHLGVSMRTKKELIATRLNADPQKIARAIGATSVNYISYRGFIRARLMEATIRKIKNPKEWFLQSGGCGGCITGLYPVDRDGKKWKA